MSLSGVTYLLIFIIGFNSAVFSQNRTSIYIEGMGHGIVYSVNYEKIKIRENRRNDYAYFIGLYLNPIDGGSIPRSIGIPLGVNKLRKVKNSYLELGIGFTFMYGVESANVGSAYMYTRLAYRKNFKKTYLRFSLHPVYIIDTNLFNKPDTNNFAGEWAFWPGIAFGFYRSKEQPIN